MYRPRVSVAHDVYNNYIIIPFFIKHKTAEIAIIMAVTLNINTPSTLPTISPPLVPDVVEISVIII